MVERFEEGRNIVLRSYNGTMEESPGFQYFRENKLHSYYVLDAARSSGILKAKQKLGVTFNSDKVGGIDFTKFSKLSMCSAGAGRCWQVLAGTMAWASS